MIPPRCQPIQDEIDALEPEIELLQHDLQTAARNLKDYLAPAAQPNPQLAALGQGAVNRMVMIDNSSGCPVKPRWLAQLAGADRANRWDSFQHTIPNEAFAKRRLPSTSL